MGRKRRGRAAELPTPAEVDELERAGLDGSGNPAEAPAGPGEMVVEKNAWAAFGTVPPGPREERENARLALGVDTGEQPGRYYPPEHQLASLASQTLLSVRTVRRWYADPQRTEFGNRTRLRIAATVLGIPLPVQPGAE